MCVTGAALPRAESAEEGAASCAYPGAAHGPEGACLGRPPVTAALPRPPREPGERSRGCRSRHRAPARKQIRAAPGYRAAPDARWILASIARRSGRVASLGTQTFAPR